MLTLTAILGWVVGREGTVMWTEISLTDSSLKRNSQTKRCVPFSFWVQRVLCEAHNGIGK